jgi:hypothetical protein
MTKEKIWKHINGEFSNIGSADENESKNITAAISSFFEAEIHGFLHSAQANLGIFSCVIAVCPSAFNTI